MAAANQPQPPVFRWELCADLHGRILDVGWKVVTDETGWEPDMSSWWDHYFSGENGNDSDGVAEHEKGTPEMESDNIQLAAELQRRLHPDVVRFLKKARHDYPGTEDSCHFFYFLEKLMTPQRMIDALNNDPATGCVAREPQPDQYVCLYCFPDSIRGCLM
jgi:hypothetical protein